MDSTRSPQVLAQSPFFYYKPEPHNDCRQHGMFTSHPNMTADGIHMQHLERPVHVLQQSTMYPSSASSAAPAIYQPRAIAPVHAILTPAASPGPREQKPAFLYNPHLSLNTGCSAPDAMAYPSTPPLSVSGDNSANTPSSGAFQPTPLSGTFMAIENIEGVKVGCEGDVANEILAGGDYARSCSPPLTPVLMDRDPLSAKPNQSSDLLSINSCPSLSSSPSPISHTPHPYQEFNFCDPKNLIIDSKTIQFPACTVDFPALPTLCSGDDEEHKLILGGALAPSKPQNDFAHDFSSGVVSTFGSLAHLDTFSDLDPENDFIIDLARFPCPEAPIYPESKRQKLDLVSIDAKSFLSDDSVDSCDELDALSNEFLTPPDSRRASEELEETDMKLTLTKTEPSTPQAKKTKAKISSDSAPSDADTGSSPITNGNTESSTTSTQEQHQVQNQSSESSISQPTLNAAEGDNSSSAAAAASARRGRKQSLTDDPSKTFICTLCSRRFRRQEHLKRHYRSLHTHDKPFECKECGKSFGRSDNLSQHARTHGSGAIQLGVYEEGQSSPNHMQGPFDFAGQQRIAPRTDDESSISDGEASKLGNVLFEAAVEAAGSSTESDSGLSSEHDTTASAEPAEIMPAAERKRKRED